MTTNSRKRKKATPGITCKTRLHHSPVTGELYALVIVPKNDLRWRQGQKVYAAFTDGWELPSERGKP